MPVHALHNTGTGYSKSRIESCDSAAMDTDKKIPLPNFLKLLTNNNVSTPKAMAVAGKMLSKFLHHLATCVV